MINWLKRFIQTTETNNLVKKNYYSTKIDKIENETTDHDYIYISMSILLQKNLVS